MRILIVEDEAKLAVVLRQALTEAGYVAESVRDGAEGLRTATASTFDLVILDWLLPTMSGVDVCRALRETACTSAILLLTARDSIEDRIHGLDAGADDYLTKPFALGELLARVRSLLRRSAPGTRSLLRVGDLTLDPVARRVSRGGRDIALSAKEFALLEYLMRNAGQTLSRATITEHVWDFNFDCGTNVVDVYINYLRNKIDRRQPQGVPTLLHTVRGVGYRLDAPANEFTTANGAPADGRPLRSGGSSQSDGNILPG